MESFIKDLEKLTGVQRTVFNIDSAWKEAAPSHELGSIDDFLSTVRKQILLQIEFSCFQTDCSTHSIVRLLLQ